MADNPLVAKPPAESGALFNQGTGDNGWATGISIAESAMDTYNGFKEGDWIGGSLGLVGLAADTAAMAIDPFGTLLSSAASFLMEHVKPLKDMLDWLAGNPPVIESYSTTWGNVATELGKIKQEYQNAVQADTMAWHGAAADAYRKSATEQADALAGAASAAGSVGTVVGLMGMVVGFVREFVRDLIADLVGKLIAWVLEAVFSFGFGTPVIVAQAVSAIARWAAKIAKIVKDLLDTIKRVAPMLKKLIEVFEKIVKVFGKLAGKVTGLDVLDPKNVKPGGFVQRGGGPDLPSGARAGRGDGADGDGPDGSPDSGGQHGGRGSDTSGAAGNSNSPNSSTGPNTSSGPNSSGDRSGSTGPDSPSSSSSHNSSSTPSSSDGPSRSGSRSDSSSSPDGSASSSPTTPRGGEGGQGGGSGGSDTRSASATRPDSDAPRSDRAPESVSTPDRNATPSASPHGTSNNGPSAHSDSPSSSSGTSGGPSGSPSSHSSSPSNSPSTHSRTDQTQTSAAAPPEAPPRPDQPHQTGRDTTPANSPASGQQPAMGGANPGGHSGGTPGGSRPGSGDSTGTSGHRGDSASVPSARTGDAPSRPDGSTPAPRSRGGDGSPDGHPNPPTRSDAPSRPDAPPRPRGESPAAPPRDRTDSGQHRDSDGPPRQRDGNDRADSDPRRPHRDDDPSRDHSDSDPHHRGGDPESRPDVAEAHARHNETTPSGMSSHRGDSDMGDLPQRVPNDPRYFTADVHITPDGRARVGNHTYSAAEYADMVRRGGWDGRPVRLIGCDAGSNDFARQLSRELDAPVVAPTKPAWTDSRGRVYTSDAEVGPNGNRQPRIPPNGQWETHHPDGRRSPASDDGFAPGTHDKDKDGLDPNDARDRAAQPGERVRPTHQDIDWREPHHTRTETRTVKPGEPFYDPPVHTPDPPLRGETRYDITDGEGRRTTMYTDGSNPPRITHVDAHTSNNRTGHADNPMDNPDASRTLPDANYRVHAGGEPFTFRTDADGRPTFDVDRFNAPDGPQYRPPDGDNYRRVVDHDPYQGAFSNRTDLQPDRRYDVYRRDANGNEVWHGTFHTSPELTPDGRSQFTHVDTWTDKNPELGTKETMRQPNDPNPKPEGLPLAETRIQVDDRVFHTDSHGNAAVSYRPEYGSPHNSARDGEVQRRVGHRGQRDYPGTAFRGGHTQDHISNSVNEAIGLVPQLWRENNLLKPSTDPLSRYKDSWRQMEIDRKTAHDAGVDIERVRVWPTEPSTGQTPDRLYVVEQRADPVTGKPVIHYRSFDNVPPGVPPRSVPAAGTTAAANPT